MNKTCCSIIHFDYGGCYSKNEDDVQWISRKDEVYTLVFKTQLEEITYAGLVDKLSKKIRVDEVMTKLKLSYIPLLLDPKKPSYILDDEDVYGYLMEVNKDQCRALLHVELVEQNQCWELLSRNNRESEVQTRNEELISSGRDHDIINDGIRTLHELEPPNTYELLGITNDENGSCDEFANLDQPLMLEGINVPSSGEGEQYVNHAWEDGINLRIGQEFESKKEVQDLVYKAAHQNCFEVGIIKSDSKLLVLKCHAAKDGCKWSLRVAKLQNSDYFTVRTYNNMHTCSRATTSTSSDKRKGTPRLVAGIVHEDYPGKFDTPTPKNLISIVQGRVGVKVSYSTALRGKKQAANEVRGSPEESYKLLYPYLYMLEKTNRGTITRVELDEGNKFKYLFIALGACIEGFKAMRKVIIVDGTFLKTIYGGVLIVATAQDPNRHHYPIAFGVVDGEKDASWMWFLNTLKTVIPDDPELVFISDRNASIIKSIGEVYPKSHHGYCIFHLSQNVKSHVSNVNKELVALKFRECAQVYTEGEFNTLYDSFRKRYPKAAEYLDRSVDEKKWARCYFPGERYNIDTTNCAESINAIFRSSRKYSLLPMIDVIVGKIAEWFNKHRKSSAEVPNTQKWCLTWRMNYTVDARLQNC